MNGIIPGFAAVQSGQVLAFNGNEEIRAPLSGLIFMPLYQPMGNDGFFIVRPVAGFWLVISKWFRRFRLDSALTWLPGVSFDKTDRRVLNVDRRIARFLATQLFHLLGYRKQPATENDVTLRFRRREN
ncbi:MAG: hypothetical protein R3C03_06430 [Pirellulaceae bacterium]